MSIRKIIVILSVLVTGSLIVSSCDRREDTSVDYAVSAEGSYLGKFNISLGGNNITVPQLVKVKRVGNNTVDLEIRDFQVPVAPDKPAMQVGDMKLKNVTIESADDGKTITMVPTTQKIAVQNMGEHDLKLTAGVINGKNISLNLSIVLPIMSIDISFKGER